jgi:MFS family permease
VLSDERFPTGLTIGLGSLTVVAATIVAAMFPADEGGSRLAVVAAAVAVVATLSGDLIAVPCVVVLAWLMINGFLVDRFGVLSWHGRSDVYRAVMLVIAAGLGQVAGHAWWRWHAMRWHGMRWNGAHRPQLDEEGRRDV